MAKSKALNWLIYAGASPAALGSEKNSSLTINHSPIDVSDKGSDDWLELLAGAKDWAVDCDGCYIDDDTAYDELEAAMLAGTSTTVEFRDTTNNDKRHGTCFITNLQLNASNGDAVTYSISFQGTGALSSSTY